MPIKAQMLDGRGSGQTASVMDEALFVIQAPYPPLTTQRVKPFRQYLTTNGTAGGTSSLKVVGSLAAPVLYYVSADSDNDRYITALSFVISGPGARLDQMGAAAALTNGCHLYYSAGEGDVTIHEALKSNFDFVRLCLGNPAFGTGADAFRGTNVVGNDEAFIPVLNMAQMLPPYGVKLERGSTQKLVLAIRDDTTAAAIAGFNCLAYGFDRIA